MVEELCNSIPDFLQRWITHCRKKPGSAGSLQQIQIRLPENLKPVRGWSCRGYSWLFILGDWYI